MLALARLVLRQKTLMESMPGHRVVPRQIWHERSVPGEMRLGKLKNGKSS